MSTDQATGLNAEIPAYQQRVMEERAELDARRDKLQRFLQQPNAAALPLHERNLLIRQLGAMTEYSDVLHERIVFFGLTGQEKGL